ncbi:MAG: fumarate/nitrate reduction transcriptional regulator Fnr [Gammaproteobacteria bacterium]|nr:fumarate/nitrate reduction transcriptional regulator Fnr [Gammaproteobacteria bacterium]
MSQSTENKPAKFTVSCQDCSLNALCLPYSLTMDEMDVVDKSFKRGKPFQKNQIIYEVGQTFSSIYAVRSGAIKTYSIDDSGEEHVIGFYLPGEIFGLDAIYKSTHASCAKALETSAICEMPYDQMEDLSAKIHNLQTHMYRLLSREIMEDQELQLLLSKKTAEERIGVFLLNLSVRYQQRKLSPSSFRLPMARTDIGNYLGLAVETVSRVFTRLQNIGILHVEGKEVQILDHHHLCQIAHQSSAQS